MKTTNPNIDDIINIKKMIKDQDGMSIQSKLSVLNSILEKMDASENMKNGIYDDSKYNFITRKELEEKRDELKNM